jgi:hypothetical protein
MIRRLLVAIGAPLAIVGLTGCVGLSFQSYGPSTRGHSVSVGTNRADVFANMGEPDSIYQYPNTEIYIYRGLRGANYLGIYSRVRREDVVVIMDSAGMVEGVLNVDRGRGHTLINPPAFIDPTHPVKSSQLVDASAVNYGIEK